MRTKRLSNHWKLYNNHDMHDLMPIDADQHYAGDECFCHPHRLMLRHKVRSDINIMTWIHMPSSHANQQDLRTAINEMMLFWDNVYKINSP